MRVCTATRACAPDNAIKASATVMPASLSSELRRVYTINLCFACLNCCNFLFANYCVVLVDVSLVLCVY